MKTVANEVKEKAVQVARVTMPVELLNQALQYLATRPYNEVVNIISAIQQESKAV